MEKKKSDLVSLFKRPWCPLFGKLPNIDNYLSTSVIHRCVNIINSTREVYWSIWSTKESNLSAKTLHSVRTVFKNMPDILECAKYPGYEEPDRPFTDKLFNVIWYETKGVQEELLPHHILSLLTIYYAWQVLKDVLYYGKSDSEAEIIKKVLYVSNLDSLAEHYHSAFVYGWQINELMPDVEFGRKFKEGPIRPRKDSLYKIIKKICLGLKNKEIKLTAKEVFDALPVNENDTIQEKGEDDKMIYWITPRGKERKTTYKSFLNRLSKIKKELQ